jgi:hypothetical protein
LPRGNASLWLVEFELVTITSKRRHRSIDWSTEISNLYGATNRVDRFINEPVRTVDGETRPTELIAGANHDPARIGFDPHDVSRFAECKAQTFALTDREILDAGVCADNLTFDRHNVPREVDIAPAATHELGVFARHDKTDLLAVFLLGHPQTNVARQVSDLILLILADWKHHPRQDASLDTEEHI